MTATGAGVVEFAGTRLTGPVTVRDTTGSVLLSGVRVTGPVRQVGNATGDVPIIVAGNRVTGPLACAGNEPPPVNEGEPNTVTGPRSGQCARL